MALNLLFFLVFGAATYVGYSYSQQQAFLVFSQSYAQEVNECYQIWMGQASYPKTRQWLSETIYQRRWEVLTNWGKQIVQFEKKLGQRTEFGQAIEKFMKSPADFRNPDKIKFYSLELAQAVKRLPGSEFSGHKRLLNFVASDLDNSRKFALEHKKISQKIQARIHQMETALGANASAESSNYCSNRKSFEDRKKFLSDLKEQCGEPSGQKFSFCKNQASLIDSQLGELVKEQQAKVAEIQQRWPQWREPACTP